MNLFKLRRYSDEVQVEPSRPVVNSALASVHPIPMVEEPRTVFVRGQGSWMWDSLGRTYLDFTQGGAVNSLGHCPPIVVNALSAQAQSLLNPGHDQQHRSLIDLTQRLRESTRSDEVYFFDSGAQACEGAITLARRWGQLHRGGACGIVSAGGSGFEPTVQGSGQVPFNDLAALHAAVDSQTVAVMLEPIQSDAGVIPASRDYLQGVARLCRELDILLILDEAQTGMGRCGVLLCEESYDIRADIVVLGKGLGGGMPLAALLVRGGACCACPGELEGNHHGGALMTAAGLAVLQSILEPGFLPRVQQAGQHMEAGLARLMRRYHAREVRGQGLLWGLLLKGEQAEAVVDAARQEGLLISAPQADCLRFSPALTVNRADIDEMLLRLGRALARVNATKPASRFSLMA